MPSPTFYPGNLQWLGIAKETTPGTAIAAPTIWIPVDSPKHATKITPLTDVALRGTMAMQHQQIQGMQYEELGYKTYFYADSVYAHFLAMLGTADTVTGTVTAPTTTLASASVVGATTISVAASIPASTLIQIDTGYNAEIVTTSAVSGTGPYTLTVPALAKAHASSVQVTKVVAPFTHADSLYNGSGTDNAQPPSFTGFLYEQGGKVAQIAGMRMADLKVDFKANDWPTLDVMWNGMPVTYITAPANTPTSLAPLPPFTTSVTIGGVANSKYSDVSIDIKRDTKPIPVLNGSHAPLGIYAGGLTVTGTMTGVFQGTADNDLTSLLTNNQPALSVALFADGDSTHPFTLQMSKVAYDTAEPQPSNNSWMTIQSNIKALGNATDALDTKESPCQAILVNSTSAAF